MKKFPAAWCTVILCALCGCRDPWQSDACMQVASTTPVPAAVSPEVPACHWLGAFKYLEVPQSWPAAEMPVSSELAAALDSDSAKNENLPHAAKNESASPREKNRGSVRHAEPVVLADISPQNCIDINAADELTLTKLPGIGAGKAKAIMAAREKRPFKRKKDITRIKGIGPKSFQRMAAMICEISKT